MTMPSALTLAMPLSLTLAMPLALTLAMPLSLNLDDYALGSDPGYAFVSEPA